MFSLFLEFYKGSRISGGVKRIPAGAAEKGLTRISLDEHCVDFGEGNGVSEGVEPTRLGDRARSADECAPCDAR